MNIYLNYHLRLGDILRILPIAEWLSKNGDDVFIICNEEYHDMFRCVPYCKPIKPSAATDGEIINLQIWPEHYSTYRMSRKPWAQFVYGLAGLQMLSDFDPIPRLEIVEPEHDYQLPENCTLVSPFSISGNPPELKMQPHENLVLLLAPGQHVEGFNSLTAERLSDLPWLIANAWRFITVNTATTVIASAVRDTYEHIVSTEFAGQDDFYTHNQKRITL